MTGWRSPCPQRRCASGRQSRNCLEGSVRVGAPSDLCRMVHSHGGISGIVSIVDELPHHARDASLHDVENSPRRRSPGSRSRLSQVLSSGAVPPHTRRLLEASRFARMPNVAGALKSPIKAHDYAFCSPAAPRQPQWVYFSTLTSSASSRQEVGRRAGRAAVCDQRVIPGRVSVRMLPTPRLKRPASKSL